MKVKLAVTAPDGAEYEYTGDMQGARRFLVAIEWYMKEQKTLESALDAAEKN